MTEPMPRERALRLARVYQSRLDTLSTPAQNVAAPLGAETEP